MDTILLKPFISAPIDIMIMLLGAFAIGFVIAWLLGRQKIREMDETSVLMKKKIAQLSESNDTLEVEKMKLAEELESCQERYRDYIPQEDLDKAKADLRAERERGLTVRGSLNEIENAYEALKQELEVRIGQMISQEEATRLKAEANRLKVFNASLQEEITQLRAKQDLSPEISISSTMPEPEEVPVEITTSYTNGPEAGYEFLARAGIQRADNDKRDDLKRINGVGPFIEKKLNQIGIYTFEQIASLSDHQTEQVTEAIEFFPGRIKRDDWVGQARRLMD